MYTLYFNHTATVEGQRLTTTECFYDDSTPTEEYKVVSPKLNKEVGKAGSLSFILPPTNIEYNNIDRETCEIVCKKFDKEIWRGRILSDNIDFYKQRAITCEGELTYLNDTCSGNKYWKNTQGGLITYYTFIGQLLDVHNQKNTIPDTNNFSGPYDKRIYRGQWPKIQDNGRQYIETKGETVLELVNSIAKDNGLYPKCSWRDEGSGLKRYLDFVKGAPAGIANELGETTTTIVDDNTTNPVVQIYNTSTSQWVDRTCITNDVVTTVESGEEHKHIYNGVVWTAYLGNGGRYFADVINQNIIFGENLLDFTRSYDPSQIVTAVILRGSKIDTQDNTDKYIDLTTSDRWEEDGICHPLNADYIYSDNAVTVYGYREANLEVETAGTTSEQINQLKRIGKNYLRVTQFSTLTIEVSAVDLNLLGVDVDDFDIYYDVKVISDPHGLERYFPIMSLEIPLDEIQNAKYSLGTSEDITLTGAGQRANEEFYSMIKALPTEESVLNAAKNQASSLIKGATSGHITIKQNQDDKSDALIISQTPEWDPTDTQHGVWVWNSGGLGYFPNGWDGTSALVNVAITNDGSIVADRIDTGTLRAYLIHGNYIVLQESTSTPYVQMTNNSIESYVFDSQSNKPKLTMCLKPQIKDANHNYWDVFRSQIHCFECDDIMIGEVATENTTRKRYDSQTGQYYDEPIIGLTHGDCTIAVLGGESTYNTTYDPNPSSPSTAIKVYKVTCGLKELYFCRGFIVHEEYIINPDTNEPYEAFDGYVSDLSQHDYRVVNGIITTYENPSP